MSATRAQVESVLISRRGGTLARVGLDGVTVDGTNTSLSDPISYAIRQSGGTVATLGSPDDADLLTVPSTKLDFLLDIGELRILVSCLGNYAKVTEQAAGTHQKNFSDFLTHLREQYKSLLDYLKSQYGFGLGKLSSGTIRVSPPTPAPSEFATDGQFD